VTRAKREALILSLDREVRYHAGKVSAHLPLFISKRDILAAAWLGAIRAVDRFDREKGTLETFARSHIRGAIGDYLRGIDHLPRDVRKRFKAAVEVALLTGASLPQALPSVVPIDSVPLRTSGFNPRGSRAHLDECPELGFTDLAFKRAEGRMDLERIMARADLTANEDEVTRRFYLGDEKLKVIGRSIGFGESRASQVRKAAIAKLRKAA
jgi:RNA polymerase sigma factor (sigma-70 family)